MNFRGRKHNLNHPESDLILMEVSCYHVLLSLAAVKCLLAKVYLCTHVLPAVKNAVPKQIPKNAFKKKHTLILLVKDNLVSSKTSVY